jgi:DNA polymerase elongation subunit (family B)
MDSSLQKKTIIVKKSKKQMRVKSFRLLDFNVYDDRNEKAGSDSDDDKKVFKDNANFVIQMFGINEEGQTCCMNVIDFNPFFYVKVGDDWKNKELYEFIGHIKKQIGRYYDESIVSAQFINKQKLYGFSAGKQYQFIQMSFKNMAAMNKVKNLWYSYDNDNRRKLRYMDYKNCMLELYESSIPPILRYFHIHNISPSGWVYIQIDAVMTPDTKTTTCHYEYICTSAQLNPIANKETRVPYKICSFDIEASSSHGDFPVPKKNYKRLATNAVDCYLKQTQTQQIDISRGKMLLQKIIMTAFGYDTFDDIDLVYPKVMPSKTAVKTLTAKFIDSPLSLIRNIGNSDEEKRDLLTIDELFHRIDDTEDTGMFATGGENDDSDDDEDGISAPSWKKKKAANTSDKMTIVEVLLEDSRERDEKIQIMNDLMTGIFPVLEGDKTTFIGSTFIKYGEPEPYLNHCVVLGSCDPIDGIIVETVDDERSLLMKWSKLIQRENPDIIIGYNIFGFDYTFLFERSKELHCEREFLKFSRITDELCANEKDYVLSLDNTKIQLASGEYDLRYPKISGRLQIDMYTHLRKDFNLSSYKLDDVAGQFISDDIKKIETTYNDNNDPITMLYSNNLTGLHINDYIHIELSNFTSDYYMDGKKFKVIDIIRNKEVLETVKGKEVNNVYNIIVISGHENIDMANKSIKWGVAKDDVSPQDIFRLSNGNSADRAIVAKYCVQDCNLVHHLMNKIDVLTGYIEMSRICSVPISYLVFRGQGIKLTSYVAKKCRDKNTLMPDLDKSGENEGYEGAIVLPPKCSMYMDNPVACVDYASLYPSSMISQNFSHDSKVWAKEYDLDGNLLKETGEKDSRGRYVHDNLPEYQYIDIEFDTFKYVRKTPTSRPVKTKSGKMVCRWAQFPDNKKGIMPSILEELLKARSETRKMIKTEKDPFMQNILDKRQLGYKVTANSLYGQCGARTSTFYEKDVAASTTATGRMMITYAKRIIEEVYGNRVYNTNTNGAVLTKAEYVYGDSVASYTPVYVKTVGNSTMQICNIEDVATIYGNNEWIPCTEPGKQDKEVCYLTDVQTWSDLGWTDLKCIIRHVLVPTKKMIRITTTSGMVDVTDDHSLLKPDGSEISPNDCIIGTELMHKPLPTNNYPNPHPESISMLKTFVRQDRAAEYCVMLEKMGFNYKVFDKAGTYQYVVKMVDVETYTNGIGSITSMVPIDNYTGYVYDLTTENHHFAAGIGNMIVHNTDSVFFTFNLEDPATGEKIRGKKALEVTIEIAQDAAHLCTQWLKPPMELTYEKTLMPFILLSKKRYVGMLYETDPNKCKMKYMGLSIKRRDSCDYLKDTYGGILNILMKEHNIEKSLQFLNESLNNLTVGNVSMDKLSITKALRGYYKNPAQIAHKVLADRIGQRDPGNKPKSGERIKFVHIVSKDKKALQGEKIETPEFILQNKLKIDYTFYITNQLMKPLQQLYGLALEQIWEHQGKRTAIRTHKKELAEIEANSDSFEEYMKKREKHCSRKVKVLLFDKYLTEIYNKANNMRQINTFFR